MSTKTSTVQPPGRRTPLSLNTGTKSSNKPTNDKNENKKESSTNNQKTENSKKDSQPERKASSDKKQQPLTETRKPSSSSSSSSSSESKKPEDIKTTKNEENNKKNQNGASSNGVKDKEKQNTNGTTVNPKTDTTPGSSTPKKEAHKSTDKKKEITTEVVANETKNESNKNKTDEKNKDSIDNTKKQDESKKEKGNIREILEKKNTPEKLSDEKGTLTKIPEKAKLIEKSGEVINLDSSPEGSVNVTPVKSKNKEIITGTPVKEKKIEVTPKKEEKQVCSPADQLEDVEMMEPLTFEIEPSLEISAASTPAKTYTYKETHNRSAEKLQKTSPKSEIKPPRAPVTHTPDRKSCPRTFSSISGRRSIRPMGDYNFSGNLNIRESYRKINTELDFTASSMNATVGSEVPINESFSYFSSSRKRDRSSQSAMEVQGDISPKSPKRARIERGVNGFFSAIASPITMLGARFYRASIRSTPKKQVDIPIEEDIVENVSGISVEEELTATEDLTVNPDSFVDNVSTDDDPKLEEPIACSKKPTAEGPDSNDDIKIKETITSTDPQAKKKCSIM